MKTFIFIAGAPGSGKSSISKALQLKLDSPLFEFGWIPEFRNTGTKTTTYNEDEALAFENLTLVIKNYAKHGFHNIIVTDLENKRIEQIPSLFRKYNYSIFTLRQQNEELLKKRVLDTSRYGEYRNWEEALAINNELLIREAFANETFIDIGDSNVAAIADYILTLIR